VIMAAVSGCVGTCDSLPRTVPPTTRPRVTIAKQATRDCPDSGVTGPTRQRGWRGRLVSDDRDRLEHELDAEDSEEDEHVRQLAACRGA
jgi:hypothetical protein